MADNNADDNGLPPKARDPETLKKRVNFGNKGNARIRRSQGILEVIIAFSILVLADGLVKSKEENSDLNTGAAIGIGLSSLVLTFIKYMYSTFADTPASIVAPLEVIFGVLMTVLWIVGVVILTFSPNGIFTNDNGTGYFATWLCLLLTGYYTFMVWGTVARSKNNGSAPNANKNTSLFKYKEGVTPILSIAIILAIGVLAQAIIHIREALPKKPRAVFAISMAIPALAIYISNLFMSMNAYGDANNYFGFCFATVVLWLLLIMFGTYSEPFAQRVEIPDPDNVNLPPGNEPDFDFVFKVVGNGFFAVVGSFVASAVILYKSHLLILRLNDQTHKSFGMKGRHIWLFLLAISSLVVCIGAILECSNFDSCQENNFVSIALGLSFFSMFICVVSFGFCRGNEDLGDVQYINEEIIYQDPETSEQKFELVFAIVLFLMWAGASLGLTFPASSPFSATKTAFIFIWLNFGFSVMYLNQVFPKLGLLSLRCLDFEPPNKMSAQSNFGFFIIILGSIIQLIAAGVDCIDDNFCEIDDFIVFGMTGAVVVLTIVLLVLKPTLLGHTGIVLIYILTILCYANLILVTIVRGPFKDLQGNGFYAAWAVLFGAMYENVNYDWYLAEFEDDGI